MQSAYDRIRFYKIGQKEKESITKKLKESLAKEKKIQLGIVFGSLTRRNNIRDIDLCAYSTPTLNFKQFLGLNAQIELDLGISVDLVELANLSPSLRMNVLKNGALIKGQKAFLQKLLNQVSPEL